MKTLVMALSFLCSNLVWADNSLFQNYPSTMTPYQILEDAFNKAGPAKFEDLPSTDEILSKSRRPYRFLVEVTPKTTRDDLSPGYSFFRQHEKIKITLNEGKKAVGPLFPEVGPTTETKEYRAFLFCSDGKAVCQTNSKVVAKNLAEMGYSLVETPSEIEVTYTLSDFSNKITYRKTGDIILTKHLMTYGKKSAGVTYSYGWPEESK